MKPPASRTDTRSGAVAVDPSRPQTRSQHWHQLLRFPTQKLSMYPSSLSSTMRRSLSDPGFTSYNRWANCDACDTVHHRLFKMYCVVPRLLTDCRRSAGPLPAILRPRWTLPASHLFESPSLLAACFLFWESFYVAASCRSHPCDEAPPPAPARSSKGVKNATKGESSGRHP